ncbi:hypothetical protein H7H78_02320 [Mycobacterium shinjukuense]|uniref:HTH merR-type domain-containing protein n=1 Tax=Mycobacterium shinjukuense TaxID=398694 RepID=A0A7I7MMJ4_9MYCO|nr:hypothetical protein [Mycobacterium shinjukuense]MCV6984322.1 hypothetical protein [Mycobacterium shinjukuense]ORB70935.1 hypothetical protein BST45_04245 [Mycobacterium shinjukuense]BBX73042.1 hypothetical protein MSHI_09480 [Mycobacterium shinjukuense]
MAEQAWWTLDELVRRVAAALADPAYPGAPNGRVRELPDRRAVRWYTTTGLVDRPAMQGRTARYGTRHLLQVVAVKRRQAEGRSLAEIQAELAGATDDTLRRVAAIPDDQITPESVPSQGPPPATRPGRRSRFWADPPAAVEPSANANGGGADTVTALSAVALPGGALLLLPANRAGPPDDHDADAIRAAARPLLDLLADRGLLSGLLSLDEDERSPS